MVQAGRRDARVPNETRTGVISATLHTIRRLLSKLNYLLVTDNLSIAACSVFM
jgi:hypothetical protein